MSKFGLKWENMTLQCEVTHASVSYDRAKNPPDTPQDKHLSWRGTFQLKNAPDFFLQIGQQFFSYLHQYIRHTGKLKVLNI